MKQKKAKKQTNRKNYRPASTSCYYTDTGTTPDYKEVLTLKRFVSDRGKILPQKYSGLTSKNQRLLAKELKKARFMALIPYTDRHAI